LLDTGGQEAEIRRMGLEANPGKQFARPYLEKSHHKKKKALSSSNPSIREKKRRRSTVVDRNCSL
jgi:hypothetical protein